ncbi:MAG: hypothetical protein N3C12_01385 [Candidatus Binatia bacterium]|nr:hypothetical protein [Candidatus Binatia bacterium]
MRTIILPSVLFGVLCGVVGLGLADPSPGPTVTPEARTPEASPSPEAQASKTPAAESVTQAFGEIPESLAGLWLMVTQAQVGPGKVRNNFHLYRIRHEGSQWRFQRLQKPEHLECFEPLVAAERDPSPFRPSSRQLAKVKAEREQLAALPALPEASTFQVVHIRSGDAILPQPPPPPAAAGTKLAIEFLEQTSSPNTLSAVSFYVKKLDRDQMEGDIHALTLVAGMGVVPIVTPGKFLMFRIE